MWLPHYGFGVGTKIDAREAYRTLRLVRTVFVILFLLLVLASLVILLYSYRQVMWRRRLTEAELKARQLGQYQLVEKIGEGGMGIVYKAHHALLRRETALKLLTPDKADAVSIQRFEREVRLTCRLMHPNTIQIYDYGHTPEGIFYYAMEYLDGLNLGELVERYGPQPEGRVVNLLIQICESLARSPRPGPRSPGHQTGQHLRHRPRRRAGHGEGARLRPRAHRRQRGRNRPQHRRHRNLRRHPELHVTGSGREFRQHRRAQ